MNKNVNVFIAVLLCALLCGGVMWLRMASEEKLGWNIQDTYDASPAYSSGSSYADATFVGPSSGGMMSVTSSRRSLRARAASSYASSAATQPLTSHLSPLTSHLSPLTSHLSPLTSSAPAAGGLYTTSSQTFKSFGGGNNAGVSMSGGSLVATNNYAQTSSAVSISSPISYTSLSRNNSANFQEALANGLSPEAVIASSMAMPTNGSLFGSYYTNDFTSSVDAYNPGSYNGIGYSGIGRQNNAINFDTWILNWLKDHLNATPDANGQYWVSESDLYAAWLAFIETQGTSPGGMTWEQLLAWFGTSGNELSGGGYRYNLMPIGDPILPLGIIILLYIFFLFIKKRSFA